MGIQLTKLTKDFLSAHPEQKFTAREIADWIFNTYPAECEQKKTNSASSSMKTDDDLVQQIIAEIGSRYPRLQKNNSKLKTTEGRPRKYYYSEMSDRDAVDAVECSVTNSFKLQADEHQKKRLTEHELYPLLSRYLFDEMGVYAKRIDEKRSSNKNGAKGNHWLHPDMVGMEDLGAEWNREVQDCTKEYGDKRTKLWSFEAKLLINRSNVRECFFQAVSNSSWANFGYLVASEIDGTETLKEMRMLSAAHGIGLIQLNVENPAESQVLIPARERNEIDWDMANRLATENTDFLNYIKLVKQFYQTGEPKLSDWDIPKTPD